MPRVSLTCPSCETDIRVPGPLVPGRKVRCPECEEKFVPETDDEEQEEEGEEEEERPRKKRKKRKQESSSNLVPILVFGGGGALLLLLAGGVVLILWATGVFDKSSKKASASGSSSSASGSSSGQSSSSAGVSGSGVWQNVHADKGKFNVKAPGIVFLLDGDFAQASGTWNDQSFLVRTAPMNDFDKGKTLQQVVDEDISFVGKQKTNVTLQGYPGGEVSEDNGKVITRVYISKKMKYTLSVSRLFGQGPADRSAADQFFNSFQIID